VLPMDRQIQLISLKRFCPTDHRGAGDLGHIAIPFFPLFPPNGGIFLHPVKNSATRTADNPFPFPDVRVLK
jgi:hypothetical protein